MTTICISGASDDLIEVDGDIALEGDVPADGTADVHVNGTRLLTVTFTREGLWRIAAVGQVDGVQVQVFPTPGEDVDRVPAPEFDVARYSDYAILTGPITSLRAGTESWPS